MLVTARGTLVSLLPQPIQDATYSVLPNLADPHKAMCARVSPLLGKENLRTHEAEENYFVCRRQ
jgi:hypothetical protein